MSYIVSFFDNIFFIVGKTVTLVLKAAINIVSFPVRIAYYITYWLARFPVIGGVALAFSIVYSDAHDNGEDFIPYARRIWNDKGYIAIIGMVLALILAYVVILVVRCVVFGIMWVFWNLNACISMAFIFMSIFQFVAPKKLADRINSIFWGTSGQNGTPGMVPQYLSRNVVRR